MAEQAVDIVSLLEDFFSEPTFTCRVAEFTEKHAASFDGLSPDDEQPLVAMDIYNQYTPMIEALLTEFIVAHGLTTADVLSACEKADRRLNACVDYLLASTDYHSFLLLMQEHNSLNAWDVGGDEYPGGNLESLKATSAQ